MQVLCNFGLEETTTIYSGLPHFTSDPPSLNLHVGVPSTLGLCGPKDVLQDAFVPKSVDDKKGIPFPLGPTPGPITLL